MFMAELKLNKEYEWFLTEAYPQNRNGGLKYHLVWSCIEVNCKITERSSILRDGQPGVRLVELMTKLDPLVIPEKPPKPADFFIRGKVHLIAKVQRHWIEGVNDRPVYEFVYDSIKPVTSKAPATITDAMKTKAKFLARKAGSLQLAKESISREAPDLIPAFEELVKSGDLVFA
jgi:hypothetical protein